MKFTRPVIIGSSIVSFFAIIGIASGIHTSRAEMLESARESAARSNALFESARMEYCAVYLAHLSSCYDGKQFSCDVLGEIAPEYNELYGADINADCGSLPHGAIVHEGGGIELMETESGIPEQHIEDQAPASAQEQTDPLFFDDSLAY